MLLAREYQLLSHRKPNADWSFDEMIQSGLPVDAVSVMSKLFATDKKNVAEIVGLSLRRINQIERANKITATTKALTKEATERALLTTSVFQKAVAYFGDHERAQHWFNTKNMGLGNRTPLSVCTSYTGIRLVENTLIKLEYGMTA